MPAKKQWIEVECCECHVKLMVMPYRVVRFKYCSHACGNKAKARDNRIYNSERQRNKGNGIAYRKWFGRHMHRVVAEVKLGRPLQAGEIVHHIDGNILNNHPDNLEVTSQSRHVKHHFPEMLEARKVKAGY